MNRNRAHPLVTYRTALVMAGVRLRLAAAGLFAIVTASASAGPVVVTFSGQLTETLTPSHIAALGYDPSIAVGAPFSGSFDYDPALATDDLPLDSRIGLYRIGTTMTGGVGAVEFVAYDTIVDIHDNLAIGGMGPPDNIVMGAFNGLLGGNALTIVDVRLGGAQDIFSNDALPLALDLADFPDVSQFTLAVPFPGDDAIELARGIVTSLTIVPEPTSLVTLMIALALIFQPRMYRYMITP